MKSITLVAALASAGLFTTVGTNQAQAQVAGSTTTIGISVDESTKLAMGWSVKKTILGKTVYNDQNQKVGTVEDLIISPDRNVSYAIVGAGGFIGMGRHDVAIPVSQITNEGGKLIMPGATKDVVKSLPTFVYATNIVSRDQFVANAEKDIARGKEVLVAQEKKASVAAADVKAKLDLQIAALQMDLKSAEGKLAEMKTATANRWKEFEASVNAATARLRKSIHNATA